MGPTLLPSPATHPTTAELPDILFLTFPYLLFHGWFATNLSTQIPIFYLSFIDKLADVQVCVRPSLITG